eukprot:g12783.t1
MLRLQSNEKETFSSTLKASSQETEAALRRRRREMDQAWDRIDQGWKELQQRMTDVGITKPSDAKEGMVRLNVGGSHVNSRRSVLDGKQGSSPSGWSLGDLFEAQWDKRLPVDTDGRVVLDESIAVKHLIHALLTGASAAEGDRALIAANEKPCLQITSRALGLSERVALAVTGGSAILGPAISDTSKAALSGCPNGQAVSEIEVFEVRPMRATVPPTTAALPTLDESDVPAVMTMKNREDDVYNFGVLIADSLMEERMALRDAEIDLRRAGAKVSASAKVLEMVYGPHIAAGDEDPVVELSVCGTRMTTLRSTLQACPDSALVTRFDEARWPANERDVDEHGRRVIGCSPSVFSKVLDVLRIRKRASWTGGDGRPTARVAIKAVERKPFEEFIDMQFPGCESFVTDCIDFLEEPKATGYSAGAKG